MPESAASEIKPALILGYHKDIPFEEYCAADAINNSKLSLMFQSPAHCHYDETDDSEEDETESAAKRIGRITHSMVLERDTFNNHYVTMPEGRKKPTSAQIKAAKPPEKTIELLQWWADFQAENDGKLIITQKELDVATSIRAAVHGVEITLNALTGGTSELTGFWRDWEHGCLMKMRLDMLNLGWLIDLKSCDSAKPDNFMRSIAKFGYHRQAAIYLDGHEAIKSEPAEGFMIIACEKKPPYVSVPYVLSKASIERGRIEYRAELARYLECKKSGVWMGYAEGTVDIDLPKWY